MKYTTWWVISVSEANSDIPMLYTKLDWTCRRTSYSQIDGIWRNLLFRWKVRFMQLGYIAKRAGYVKSERGVGNRSLTSVSSVNQNWGKNFWKIHLSGWKKRFYWVNEALKHEVGIFYMNSWVCKMYPVKFQNFVLGSILIW